MRSSKLTFGLGHDGRHESPVNREWQWHYGTAGALSDAVAPDLPSPRRAPSRSSIPPLPPTIRPFHPPCPQWYPLCMRTPAFRPLPHLAA